MAPPRNEESLVVFAARNSISRTSCSSLNLKKLTSSSNRDDYHFDIEHIDNQHQTLDWSKPTILRLLEQQQPQAGTLPGRLARGHSNYVTTTSQEGPLTSRNGNSHLALNSPAPGDNNNNHHKQKPSDERTLSELMKAAAGGSFAVGATAASPLESGLHPATLRLVERIDPCGLASCAPLEWLESSGEAGDSLLVSELLGVGVGGLGLGVNVLGPVSNPTPACSSALSAAAATRNQHLQLTSGPSLSSPTSGSSLTNSNSSSIPSCSFLEKQLNNNTIKQNHSTNNNFNSDTNTNVNFNNELSTMAPPHEFALTHSGNCLCSTSNNNDESSLTHELATSQSQQETRFANQGARFLSHRQHWPA